LSSLVAALPESPVEWVWSGAVTPLLYLITGDLHYGRPPGVMNPSCG